MTLIESLLLDISLNHVIFLVYLGNLVSQIYYARINNKNIRVCY